MNERRLLSTLALTFALVACGGGNTNPPPPPPPPPPQTGSISGNVDPGDTAPRPPTEPSAVTIDPSPGGLNTVGESQVIPGEVIVKFRSELGAQSLSRLSVGGRQLGVVRPLSLAGTRLYRAEGASEADTVALARALAARADVVYAEPNYRMYALADREPDDAFYKAGLHWHYSAMNMKAAWGITVGDERDVKVAVLDTGILKNHPDLKAKWVGGYDFISDPDNANDGGGRDPDAEDAGDELEGQSSYHGSHVAGTVGASTNNNLDMAGVSWGAKIVPVRVLGTKGGSSADIAEGILWSVGASATANPNPAQVLNLSLGGNGSCPQVYQDAFKAAADRGAISIVAAGNENEPVENKRPANCNNVITVGATGPTGARAPYSNYGSLIDVMAPGGDTSVALEIGGRRYPAGVLSAVKIDEDGKFAYKFYQGTSMATPHVAGLVALMKAREPGLTLEQVRTRLKAASTPLTDAQCGQPSACGAGLVNAAKALAGGGGGTPPPPPPPPTGGAIKTYVLACYYANRQCDVSRSNIVLVRVNNQRTPYTVPDLEAGDYLVGAWQDVNGDEDVNNGEPFGVNPNLIELAANEDVRFIDVELVPFQPTSSAAPARGDLGDALKALLRDRPLPR